LTSQPDDQQPPSRALDHVLQQCRLKGIARMGDGWVRFDIAGGRPSIAAFAPKGEETARVIAIGRHLNQQFLTEAFAIWITHDVGKPLTSAA
jgi:hypothetical protein